MKKKLLVLSGVNLIDGGALSVYTDILQCLKTENYLDRYQIIALVGNKALFREFENDFTVIEFPKSKKSWLYRIYYEYFYFKRFSKDKEIDVWLSVHDMTPDVRAKKRYVYCHNPSPFNKMSIRDAKYGFKYYLFSKFYKYLYRINIKKNDAVIVQQDWMRKEFQNLFHIDNIIVARPSIPELHEIKLAEIEECSFIYPSYPRYYKNFQVVCEAARLLAESGIDSFKVYITLDGTENTYSQNLYEKYAEIKQVVFCGLLPREELYRLYGEVSALVFMSKLETWGMPILEFKQTGKPIILSDLPYAHETAGTYGQIEFADVDNAMALAKVMRKVVEGKTLSSVTTEQTIDLPYAGNWRELFQILL